MRVRLDTRCPHGAASVQGRHRGDPHCQVPPAELDSLGWFEAFAGALADSLERLDGRESDPPVDQSPEGVAGWIVGTFERIEDCLASVTAEGLRADPSFEADVMRCHELLTRAGQAFEAEMLARFGEEIT